MQHGLLHRELSVTNLYPRYYSAPQCETLSNNTSLVQVRV